MSALLYDALQLALGLPRSRRKVARLLEDVDGKRVVDVGAGTGAYIPALPSRVEYVAVDIDAAKLRRLQAKYPSRRTIRADGTALPLPDAAAEYGLCIAVAHHLSDDQLARLVDELARVVTEGLVFLDPLRADESIRSRLLWRIDQGAHPRTAAALIEALERRFDIVSCERYRIVHGYLLCLCRPREAGAVRAPAYSSGP